MAKNKTGRPDGNTLPAGSSRIGFIYDGNADTPHISALLENTGKGLVLTVPWSQEYASEYRGWFNALRSPSDAAEPAIPIPEQILFRDRLGPVALIGCSAAGFNDNLWPVDHGAGRVRATFAVMGANLVDGFTRISGLESGISGLGEWMGLKSVSERHTFKGKLRYRIEAEAPGPRKLGHRLNLSARPVFSIIRSVPDETTIRETTRIRTEVERARGWEDHFAVHRAIRDLISVATWDPATFQSHSALPSHASLLVPDRPPVKQWRPVVTHATGIGADQATDELHFLFRFDDIGTAGVHRWLQLRENFNRAIDPIVASLNFPTGAMETSMVEVSIGLEALGFQLALEQGESRTQARARSFAQRIHLIGSAVPFDLPFNSGDLGQRAADVYNGLKHANRQRPEFIDTINAWRELVVLFRFWVASRLGAPAESISRNFDRDPMQYRYELA